MENGGVEFGFSIDPVQGLSFAEELGSVRLGAQLGYRSAWTPSGGDAATFDRCAAWNRASGLPTGISVVPASAQPAAFYAEQARRVWEASGGAFVLGVGSGRLAHPATEMRPYLTELRRLLPSALPLYVAALGPRMLGLAAELADGVLLNWCSAEQVRWSRAEVERAAVRFGRGAPVIAEYIRTAVDSDPDRARGVLARATEGYALGPSPYRRHFERMGFAEELRRHPSIGAELSPELLSAVGAWGVPGSVRDQVLRLAEGLDIAIIRVLVATSGDATSAGLALEECQPA
jgi:alkanesulfonate monooxygenase SsuD/methylene tetrahydromethanopterin reductase-like flavin-dependent oxidoreductase (luciferase family)